MNMFWLEIVFLTFYMDFTIAKGDTFIIDHSGHLGTTLSPKALRELKEQEKEQKLSRKFNYEDDSTLTNELKAHSSSETGGNEAIVTGLANDELSSTCRQEGGACRPFEACDTVTHIYKGYCTTDYSSVCCVPRETICEANDGICTDDPIACVAAGEIMGRKYDLRFYAWMQCNQTHVCCRPSKKSNILSQMSQRVSQKTEEFVKKQTNDEYTDYDSVDDEEMPVIRNKKDKNTSFKNAQTEEIAMSLPGKPKIAIGTGFKAPPGFPTQDIISPAFQGLPDGNVDTEEEQSSAPSPKQAVRRRAYRPANNSRRKQTGGTNTRQRSATRQRTAANTVGLPTLPAVSPYASLLYSLAETAAIQQYQQQQAAVAQQLQQQQQAAAAAASSYVSPVSHSLTPYSPEYPSVADTRAGTYGTGLNNYGSGHSHYGSNIDGYSSSVRSQLSPQSYSPSAYPPSPSLTASVSSVGSLAQTYPRQTAQTYPSSLFGNIYLK